VNQARPPFYLVTGLLLGLILGYGVSVLLFPARAAEGAPRQLNAADKMTYRSLVAQAYAVSNNLDRASARISLLQDDSAVNQLAADAQRMLAEGKPLGDAEVLARLASALGSQSLTVQPGAVEATSLAGVPLFTPDPAQVSATESSPATSTPVPQAVGTRAPTPSPAPTLGAPFQLSERLVICQESEEPGMIQVQVGDQAGSPVPGVKIDITWQAGEEFFFTGLVQSVNPGFADYRMTPGLEYALRVGERGEQVGGVTIPECSRDDGSKYPGSVFLRFTQP
jgi:hypothetical protein